MHPASMLKGDRPVGVAKAEPGYFTAYCWGCEAAMVGLVPSIRLYHLFVRNNTCVPCVVSNLNVC